MALTIEEAQKQVIKFCKTYRLASMITYQIRETQEEIYGPERTREKVGAYFGSFRPSRGQADFAAANFRDTDDFEGTLRHEILGHFGINTFTPGEKRAVLEAIVNGRDRPGLMEIWDHVGKHYPELEQFPLRKAEEVYAMACEGIYPQRASQKVEGERAMREVCIARTRPLELRDLICITNMVAEGMRDLTRRPLTVPTSDQDQFKKETTDLKTRFHEAAAGTLNEPLDIGTDVALNGVHIGKVLGVANGLLLQKVGRHCDPVRHLVARLSAAANVGDIIEIRYKEGHGQVIGLSPEIQRGR